MSYQVLARKWRPRSFREMVGQAHVLKALISALDTGRLHHAYLFTGTRGVGKTTIARIMAKCLNCEQGVSSTPCGECSTCREIDEGRFVDLIEVDAASKTKVEDTRELLDNVQYMPSRGQYKVYLIDEVHMLSTSSFNALLKTLEEPPPHVKFLLATTDPQKLPATVLSRCLQFSLKNMPPAAIVGHLNHVLSSEQVPFEEQALWLLGRAADGSMRDAMSLTDQAVSFGDGQVLAEDVRAMLGTLDQGQVFSVVQALSAGDAQAMLQAIDHLAEQGPDWQGVLAELLGVLHRTAIAQVLPDAVDNGQGDKEQILQLAQALPAEDVQFYYQVALLGRRDLPLAPDARDGFEMVMLRMLAFRPATLPGAPRTALVSGSAGGSTDGSTGGSTGGSADGSTNTAAHTAASTVSSPASAAVSAETVVAERAHTPAVADDDAAVSATVEVPPWEETPTPRQTPVTPSAAPLKPADEPAVTASESQGASKPEPESAPAQPVPEPSVTHEQPPQRAMAEAMPTSATTPRPVESPVFAAPVAEEDNDEDELEDFSALQADLDAYASLVGTGEGSAETVELVDLKPDIPAATGLAARWIELTEQLGLSGMTGSIVRYCAWVQEDGNQWWLHLDPDHSALFNETQHARINEAINQHLGREVVLHIEIQVPQVETPALALARRRAVQQRDAVQSIEDDPLVQAMISTFGATLNTNTITPINPI